jgi:glycosyltransferase involved in cell wall biosynthesis
MFAAPFNKVFRDTARYSAVKSWVASGQCPLNRWILPADDGQMVSVMIPARNEIYLQRTVDNLLATTAGKVEILVFLDGWDFEPKIRQDDHVRVLESKNKVGYRAALNRMADAAAGKFIMKTDAHTKWTYGWDIRLKSYCQDRMMVVPMDWGIQEDVWEFDNPCYGAAYIGKETFVAKKWWDYRKNDRGNAVEIMTTNESAWLMRKDYYQKLGGFEEAFSMQHFAGPELTTKIWTAGGQVILARDVVHGHLFRKTFPYAVSGEELEATRKKVREYFVRDRWPGQIHSFEWMLGRFWPVPEWVEGEGITMEKGETWMSGSIELCSVLHTKR